MKTSITDPQPPAITYPCLMVSLKDMIVLFTSEKEGTVVHAGNGPHFTGYHSDDWIRAGDTHIWTHFNGTLNLSNS